ncbi:MAG: hypothetical protein V4735_08075 [Pseudomonadota bacterium]
MKRSMISALALTAALLAGSAVALESPNKPTGPIDTKPGTHGDREGRGPMKPISRDEWNKRFEQIDANHDGVASPEEMKAHHEKMRGMRGGRSGPDGERGPRDGKGPAL